jgi:hypothetical protein
MDQKDWGLTLLQHDNQRTYGSSLREGAWLWSVHFAGKKRQEKSLGVIEDVAYVRIGGGEALQNAGKAFRRCLTGREWRWRYWRLVYRIEQRKEAAYHWQGGFLSAF